jgi:hypothetical protein
MKALPLLLLMVAQAPPVDHPRTYLASVVGFPLKQDESVESFSIETWGVTFGAVCRIPPGWRITAGNSATPDGVLAGEGSHGATWFSQSSPKALSGFVLVTLYAPVQEQDIVWSHGKIPATFSGSATISTVDDGEVKASLTSANVRLIRATHG